MCPPPARRFVEMTENLVVWLEPLKLLLQDRLSYPYYRGARDRAKESAGLTWHQDILRHSLRATTWRLARTRARHRWRWTLQPKHALRSVPRTGDKRGCANLLRLIALPLRVFEGRCEGDLQGF